MRIACLQFAPRLGDVDNNLTRADAVLSKACPEELDLLVLPELAFTAPCQLRGRDCLVVASDGVSFHYLLEPEVAGYNFKSLQQISPFLEPSCSGVSSLWARTTALKYNCNVVVGYPEKVDVSPRWPTSPEYYSSTIVVNGDGETVAHYRKTFLYPGDEPWALEGKEGFFKGYFPDLGVTAIGISMDINPYKFENPWNKFEFAFHVLEVQANLVVVTMSWVTLEDGRGFSRMPQEPDVETVTYWVQRLEPIIRAEREEEVIVVFCNRTGIEDDAHYAGSSAVVGIKEGEVSIYGLLGRGVKDLLVVDTNTVPYAKLVYRPDENPEPATPIDPDPPSPKQTKRQGDLQPKESPNASVPEPATKGHPHEGVPPNGLPKSKKPRPTQQIVIPQREQRWSKSGDSPTVPTPTAPSPTPDSVRPKVFTPDQSKSSKDILTPYPRGVLGEKEDVHIYGGDVSIVHDDAATPSSATDEGDPESAKYFWISPFSVLAGSGEKTAAPAVPDSPRVASSFVLLHPGKDTAGQSDDLSSVKSDHGSMGSSRPTSWYRLKEHGTLEYNRPTSWYRPKKREHDNDPKSVEAQKDKREPHSPATPEALNPPGSEVTEQPDIDAITQRLQALGERPGSAFGRPSHVRHESVERPSSPKSRNASRNRDWEASGPLFDERTLNMSRASIRIGVSPSVFDSNVQRPQSAFRPESRRGLHRPASRSASQQPFGDHTPPTSGDAGGTRSERRPTPVAGTASLLGRQESLGDISRAASRGRQLEQMRSPTEQALAAHAAGLQRRDSEELQIGFDDEIIEVHEYVDPRCVVHGTENGSTSPRRTPPEEGIQQN